MKKILMIAVAVACTATFSSAQTFTTIKSFNGANGTAPAAALVQGTDGNFYGTTYAGGVHNDGTVFRISATGKLILYSFCSQPACSDGEYPEAGLVQGTDGNFYGATAGGADGPSTIFKISSGGKLITLHAFCSLPGCQDGYAPASTLIQGADGKFYGTAAGGGVHEGGTVFSITPSGTLTVLYSFCSDFPHCPDGEQPYGPLAQGTNGNLYGTTVQGGDGDGYGTVFEITPSGTLTTLHSFCSDYPACSDGLYPYSGLMLGSDGSFYGTTIYGGNDDDGTVFNITYEGVLTTLYRFCSQPGCTDGQDPEAGLVEGTDAYLYGTTYSGGLNDGGTIFQVAPNGSLLTTLYNFCSQPGCTDGEYPLDGLTQGTNGSFYGTTSHGGNSNCKYGCGTVFSLTGLDPFIVTRPTSGKVGAVIQILGNNLTGTTDVNFNGTVAAFDVLSDTLIKATVPAGATTGTVTVTAPAGVLDSNFVFHVRK
jgi:uncharacterized repeat protein (TIGR03803 family)